MKLTGTSMLITGASRGVGRALAVHFAGMVRRLTLVARNGDGLEETAAQVVKRGAECAHFITDLSDFDAVERLTQKLNRFQDPIDVLINNAADVTSKPLDATSNEEIESLIKTNIGGPLILTRELAAGMARHGGGFVVNISSLAGYKPNPSQTVYSITKTAVNGMTDALEAEYGPRGVGFLNVALMSVGVGPGQIPADDFATRLQHAIERDQRELYLSSLTKWLMRLYRFYPPLARMRPAK